jgi:Skp family chaperone for outer membrane proteins
VVDLDRVARDMGWLNAMQKDLAQCSSQLQSDVKQFTGIYEQQFRALTQPATKEGASAPAPASAELTRDAVAARQQVLQLRQKADQIYAAYRVKLVMHYREVLTPIVRQVAHSHNETVVLLKNDTVLLVEPEADITNEVLSAARAKPPEVTPIPMPRLDAPLELTLPGNPTTEPSLKP